MERAEKVIEQAEKIKGFLKRFRRASSPKPATPPEQQQTPAQPPSSAPYFPSAYPYGNNTSGVSYPNAYGDLSHQFNNLNITPPVVSPPPAPPPVRPYTGDGAGGPPGPYGGYPQQQQQQQQDYPPLRNPLPRPPAQIAIPQPEPYNHYYAGGLQAPAPPFQHANTDPSQQPQQWNGYSSAGPSAASTPGLYPPTATPGRVRPSSVPASPSSGVANSSSGVTQCAGVTKSNKKCTRIVKLPPALGYFNPDDDIPRYCFQHSKEMLVASGFYARDNKGWIDFDAWIPSYLQEGTKVILRSEMEKPISNSDVEGYIYCYELRDTKNPEVINLKVGRAVNLVKRIDEWTKTCESKEPILRGWWPGPDDGDHHATSLMKGRVIAGSKGKNCHRLERLIHLELADLAVSKPYLTAAFAKNAPKDATKDKAKPKPKVTPKKKAKKKYSDSDDDDEDEEDEEDEDEDEEVEDEEDDSTPSTTKKKPKAPRMPVRQPCKDCGAVHKEIFTFTRPESGPYKDREWEGIVQPVMEKWGRFVDGYT